MIFYIYEVKGIKNGCTTEWDKRCKQNFERYNIMPVIVETHEYPNTAEYWQIVGDREWALAELNGYPKGVHYRVAMERRSIGRKTGCSKGGKIGGPIGGKKNVESGHLESIRTKESCIKGGRISGKLKRKLTFEDAQLIRELCAKKQYNQTQLGKMYGITQQTISNIILNKRYLEP